jgi:hypothetical protein
MQPKALGKRSLAVFAASAMILSVAATVLADAPDPAAGGPSASVDGLTVTVNGTWTWPSRPDCAPNDAKDSIRQVGFAVDWGDPAAPGNPIGATGFDVGVLAGDANNPTDNAVHLAGNCTGTWGPLSHTYAAAGSYDVCVIMYDMTTPAKETGYHSLIAGGDDRNGDNSAEKNGQTPLGNGCFKTTIEVATPPASETPAQSVEAGTGTPAATQPNTSLGLLGGGGILPSIAFSLILLTALGSLAYASVRTARSRS